MRGRMWLLGVLQLSTGCSMYDGALLFVRQQPVAAVASGVADAGARDVEVSVADAGNVQMLAEDAGPAGPGDVVDEFAGRVALPPVAAGGGGAGVGGHAGAVAGGAGAGGVGGLSGSGSGVADPSCPEAGARVWADNGHCYIPVELAQSWNLSRDRCAQLGARLVTITSAQEQAFAATVGAGTSRWLGLSRFGAATFSWISGETLTYTHWQAGAPSLSGEAAALMRGDSQEWMDSAITAAHAALCERD